MKTITMIAAVGAMTMTMPAFADSMPADTLAVVNNAHTVLVTRSASTNTITIEGQGDDEMYYYSYSMEREEPEAMDSDTEEWGLSLPFLREEVRRKSEVTWLAHTQIGVCLPVDGPKGLDHSVEIAFGKIVGLNYTPWAKGPTVSFGAGIFAQKFVLHGGQMFGRDGKSLTITALPEGAHDAHIRLYNFGFDVPLTFTQNIARGFSFSTGVVMKLNTYTTASNKYTLDNRQYEKSLKELQQRILTYDIFGAIGWDEFSIYCRYSPVALFKSGNGPQFDVLSFGINLGF